MKTRNKWLALLLELIDVTAAVGLAMMAVSLADILLSEWEFGFTGAHWLAVWVAGALIYAVVNLALTNRRKARGEES